MGSRATMPRTAPAGAANERPRSPITGGDVELVKRVASSGIVARYDEQLGVDVRAHFSDVPEVSLWRCVRTGYEFFTPLTLAGDGEFYGQLGGRDWYYLEAKWEHRFVADQLPPTARVLEIGAGAGAFLQLLQRRGQNGTGLDWNPDAIARATARGLDVTNRPIEQVAAREEGGFDAVCAFQVLEHVPNVSTFLQHCLRALRPGGLLCLAVPDQDSFVGRLDLALDLPPHHMGRWTLASLRALAEHMCLDVVSLRSEPLQRAHLKSYWTDLLQRRLERPAASLRTVSRWTFPFARPWLEFTRTRLRGHSAIAVMRAGPPGVAQ